jgi:hypothetical protein
VVAALRLRLLGATAYRVSLRLLSFYPVSWKFTLHPIWTVAEVSSVLVLPSSSVSWMACALFEREKHDAASLRTLSHRFTLWWSANRS